MLGGDQKGLLTQGRNWNPPQPQLDIRARSDDQSVQNVRTRTTDVFDTNASGDYLLQNSDNFEFNITIPNEVSFN